MESQLIFLSVSEGTEEGTHHDTGSLFGSKNVQGSHLNLISRVPAMITLQLKILFVLLGHFSLIVAYLCLLFMMYYMCDCIRQSL